MTTELQTLLQTEFLNKVLLVPVAERDNWGKVIPNRFVDCAGQCTFIGSNQFMGWDLQVTVDGLPVVVKHINDIKIIERKQRKQLV